MTLGKSEPGTVDHITMEPIAAQGQIGYDGADLMAAGVIDHD